MTDKLDRLAESHGIQIGYISELGERKVIDDPSKIALLRALGVDPEGEAFGTFDENLDPATSRCEVPETLRHHKAWGIACQLYSLSSGRNLGIGDFEDLAALAVIAADVGADFVGVNPLHALFMADAARCSPYSPSSRRFLNPLYIAVDKLPGGRAALDEAKAAMAADFEALSGDIIDYAAIGRIKSAVLRTLFDAGREAIVGDDDFDRFMAGGGDSLRAFALFESLSARMVREGHHAGWHSWPEAYRDHASADVAAFAEEAEDDILFHVWLQYTADRQLGEAQARARDAGMRIGLYLDFAVGVASDGAETWLDAELTMKTARIGSPPDMFNSSGQDWGIAPYSPKALADRNYEPLAETFDALTRHAGAIRIDHAMGLARLWLIPEGRNSGGGGYVRYPLGRMVDTVSRASTSNHCLVIGEDLGTVPPGFRHVMTEAGVLSYRVLYFERHGEIAFLPPSAYPELALACISTHDLPTLTGWWQAIDIGLRAETGRQSPERTETQREERKRDRRLLLAALKEETVLPEPYDRAATGEDPLPGRLEQDLSDAVHRFLARSPSLLVAAQIEDMVGSDRQPNLPGTMDEYPNWRIRQSVPLEDLATHRGFGSVAEALRLERPGPHQTPESA
ncbi:MULTISPECIES: 4-alpha-glucanotransferase [unclassified Aureimonas]|uniref:4-alpha-glucanotransferase n=1 Tax=unclassified Aureimonas TaxID=2615206 RepID=UPI0006F366D0|nr:MULTISPECIES: 4-alpha-glucanotransferase [unclassified Aureimonas]KQT69939.1 4-alpha-glucanotransferase [Aureimonas sp. Leaf427]KQT75906.1 4-alpha-glucanotransferase [Aureimonas sp. Leaf460]